MAIFAGFRSATTASGPRTLDPLFRHRRGALIAGILGASALLATRQRRQRVFRMVAAPAVVALAAAAASVPLAALRLCAPAAAPRGAMRWCIHRHPTALMTLSLSRGRGAPEAHLEADGVLASPARWELVSAAVARHMR